MNAFSYVEARTRRQRAVPYRLMESEGLLPFAMSEHAAPTLAQWLRVTAKGVLLRCHAAHTGHLLGCGLFTPFYGQVWKFDFTAFRAGFHCAAAQARGGFAHMFERHGVSAVVGITPLRFRHAWGLAGACGFRLLGRLPGACWLARKERFEDGVLLVCTPQDLREAQANQGGIAMSFGGGGSSSMPPVPETPKAEVTKPVTEAATAARQGQKDRARKAAGLQSTILTTDSPVGVSGKTLLGQ